MRWGIKIVHLSPKCVCWGGGQGRRERGSEANAPCSHSLSQATRKQGYSVLCWPAVSQALFSPQDSLPLTTVLPYLSPHPHPCPLPHPNLSRKRRGPGENHTSTPPPRALRCPAVQLSRGSAPQPLLTPHPKNAFTAPREQTQSCKQPWKR